MNINVPDLPLDQIKGIRVTRCGTRHPADQVIPQQDPRGNTLYWISARRAVNVMPVRGPILLR
ncbi:hypothetical protein ACLB1N_31785 [Escherichia coli]